MPSKAARLSAGCLLLWVVSAAFLQQGIFESGVLIISHSGTVIGREEFVVRAGRASGDRGLTVASRVSYPADHPRVSLVPLLELRPDSQPASIQIDLLDGTARRVFAELAPRRVSIRTVDGSHESVRQYPAPDRVLFLDDSAFALHAIPPQGPAGPALMLWPRSGRRELGSWSDRGVEPTEVNGKNTLLHHIVLAGAAPRDLWYDEHGHLAKVEIPSLGLTAVRSAEH